MDSNISIVSFLRLTHQLSAILGKKSKATNPRNVKLTICESHVNNIHNNNNVSPQ